MAQHGLSNRRPFWIEALTAYAITLAMFCLSVVGRLPSLILTGGVVLTGATYVVGFLLAILVAAGPHTARQYPALVRRGRHILELNDETRPGWRRRRFLVVLIPALLWTGLILALYASGERSMWVLWRAQQIHLVRLPETGQALPFADLAHLYDAAHCSVAVDVGEVTCDRLGRSFNQNPIWVSLMRPLFDHVSLFAAGTVLMIAMVVLMSSIATVSPRAHLIVAPMLFSPAGALALERGNSDLIVWILAVPGLLIVTRGRSWIEQSLGTTLLVAASVLKVFPVFLLLPLVLLGPTRRKIVALVGILAIALYWALNSNMLLTMLGVTERGNRYSYGLATLGSVVPSRPDAVELLVAVSMVAILAVALARYASLMWYDRNEHIRVISICISTLYVLSFFSGANWAYRLIFFLPLAVAAASVVKMSLVGLQLRLAILLMWLTPGPSSPPTQLLLTVVCAAILCQAALDGSWREMRMTRTGRHRKRRAYQ
jgi:hypothetical protein